MKFKLTTSSYFYNDEWKEKLERIWFSFSEYKSHYFPRSENRYTKDLSPEIDINTIEELIDFQKEYWNLILSEWEIEIYDDYRE